MITPATLNGFELREVTVRYGNTVALDSVSLVVKAGERVGLVGPSGAGKTTLLRLLNAVVHPTTGQVRVQGKILSELSSRQLRQLRARIGFVHQDLALVPNLPVIQNVLTGRLGRQSFARALRTMLFPFPSEAEQVHDVLKRVGIEEKLYERMDRLSGGQQQRVAIARALFQEPAMLLADEPVASVDPARAKSTVELLNRLAGDQQLILCMSLHNLELARRYFPRLVGLRAGQIVFDRRSAGISDEEFARLYKLTHETNLDHGASR